MLTPLHWNTLRALMDRLIPADDFPGAWEAGVGDFLERQLESDLRSQAEPLRQGLEALEAEAQAWGGASFAALEASAQDALLGRVEAGQVRASWPVDPAGFFRAMTEQVSLGYYGDPTNGANRGRMAWRMIGFGPRA